VDAIVTVLLVVFALLWVVATLSQRDARWAPIGGLPRSARLIKGSAGLIALGLVLLGCQVAFSDGARPNLVSLPIGTIPLKLGLIALGVGLLVGLAGGSARYRFAVILGLIGAGFALIAFLFLPFTGPPGRPPALLINRLDLILAVATWALAIAIGAREVRKAPSPPRDGILGAVAALAILGSVALVAPPFLSFGQQGGGLHLMDVPITYVGDDLVAIRDEHFLVRYAEDFASDSVPLTPDQSALLASHHALALPIANTNNIYLLWMADACQHHQELDVSGSSDHLDVRIDPGPVPSGPCDRTARGVTIRLDMFDDVTHTTVDISRADE
jgi:hypothetical protein